MAGLPKRGQAIVLIAIGMAVFLAFLGLVLDGGSAYLEQRNLQRAADLSALSGAWAFHNGNYRNSDNYSNVAASIDAARTTIATTLAANGYGSVTPAVTFNDVAGTPLADQCTPTCPQGWEIRGLTVDISRVMSTLLIGVVGGGDATIRAVASAQLGPHTGARAEAPLLLQNFTDPANAVPRVGGYPACANATDGLRYPMAPTDCRPSTGAPWPAQALNLEPMWQGAFTPPAPPFDTAPVARFWLLNEPSDAAGPGSPTSQLTVSDGLPEVLFTCRPGCPAGDPGSVLRYAGTATPVPDPVFPGAGGRVSRAATNWAGQSCANPLDRANPLTPDNPRLMRLPITYAAVPGPSGVAGVGSFRVSETLMFCLDAVAGAPGAYALSGYLVEEPSNAPTILSAGDPYFGRDVVVRLTG